MNYMNLETNILSELPDACSCIQCLRNESQSRDSEPKCKQQLGDMLEK